MPVLRAGRGLFRLRNNEAVVQEGGRVFVRTTIIGLLVGLVAFAIAAAPSIAQQQPRVYTPYARVFKVDSRDIVLGPGKEIEIKYHMGKGAIMVYSWTATAVVPFEFHGDPDLKPANAPRDYYESHEKDDKGKNQSHGSFVSPSTGMHGWYWKNPTNKDVTIHLTTAGFYDSAEEFSAARTKDLQIQDAK